MKNAMMKLTSINIGQAGRLPGKPSGKSGIFKHPVNGPVIIDAEGLAGDAIVNKKHHGGVDQAVYIEGASDLRWWSEQLERDVPPGLFGENLTIEGIENRDVCVGDRFQIGEVLMEVTSARIPCATFTARMDDPFFAKRYTKAARPGAYARVLTGGVISLEDVVTFTPYQGPKVTMPEMIATFGKKLNDADRARYLAAPIHYKLRAQLLAEGAA